MADVTRWYDDADFVRQLPWLYRLYARYHRHAADSASGWIRRGPAIHAALRKLPGPTRPGEHVIEAGGVKMALDLLDYHARYAFDDLRRVDPGVEALAAALRPGDSFLDIGANYGSFALIAAHIVGPTGRVHAFEPQPRLAACLRRSADLNGFAGRLTVHQLALTGEPGEVTFYVPDQSTGKASLHEGYAAKAAGGRRELTVRTAALDNVLADTELPGRLVAKLDVEGGELAVLSGAAGVFGRHKPLLLFELHPTASRAAGYGPADLLARLGELGYARFRDVDDPAATPLAAADVPTDARRNILALPDEDAPAIDRPDNADQSSSRP